MPASVYILSGMLSRVPVSLRLFSRHLSIYLAGCYPAFSSSCSRDFSSALSSSHISLQTSRVPLYVPGCLPISSGSVAQSVPLGTFGNNTRLFSIALLVFRWALSVLLSLFFNYYSFSFASRSHYGHLRNVFSSSCSRVFSPAPPFCPFSGIVCRLFRLTG